MAKEIKITHANPRKLSARRLPKSGVKGPESCF